MSASENLGPGMDWQERLRSVFLSYHEPVRDHANVAPLLGAQLKSNGVANLAWAEVVLGALKEVGYEGEMMRDAFNALIGGLAGFVTMEFAPGPTDNLEDWEAIFAERLEAIDPACYPLTHSVLPEFSNRIFVLRRQNGTIVSYTSSFELLLGTPARPADRRAGSPARRRRGPNDTRVQFPRPARPTRPATLLKGGPMSEILVLGAGMVGVSTALALQARGHDVILADRREPGRETSYGNAGVIQVEAAEPYAIPRDLKTLLSFGLGTSNDITYSLAGLRSMAPALMRYFANSAPKTHRKAAETYSQLTRRASEDHEPLILASGSDNLVTREGLVILLRAARDFDQAAAEADRVKAEFGVASRIVGGAEWRREEPALRLTPAGVVHYTDSWSVSDPGALTSAYAALFETRGGRILTADAETLARSGTGWSLATSEGTITVQQAVICLGPWSGAFLKRFGISVPMVLKRGYHAHYDAPLRPRRPFLDAANGVVLSNMRLGMRMTSGAQLVRHDAPANPRQLRHAEAAVDPLIMLGTRLEEPQWYGTRPCLPGMLPMLGALPGQPGLWANFGHGHQGFTLGPTTAALLTEAMEGRRSPLLDALSPAAQLA